MAEGNSMAEGKPCVIRVGRGSNFEARNLPKIPPGAYHRYVGATICPIGFSCNTCGHVVRKYARITCFFDEFRKFPKGFTYTLHMFCPECFDEIIYESANRSLVSGATVHIPPGCKDHVRVPGLASYPADEIE